MNSLRRWWQIKTGKYETPFDPDVPFWSVSLIAHLVVLLLLAKIVLPGSDDLFLEIAIAEEHETDTELIEVIPEETEVLEIETEVLADEDLDQFIDAAATQTPAMELVSEQDEAFEEESVREKGDFLAADALVNAVRESESLPNLEVVAVRGTVGASLKSTGGAIDRIAEEIRLRMVEGDLMVVWLFDQSASLTAQRERISEQFNRVYEQIDSFQKIPFKKLEASGVKSPLLTDLYQFGKTCTELLSKPTYELKRLKKGIAGVERDESGIENVMSAVIQIASKYRGMTRVDRKTGLPERNVMIIVVTDEAGDDLQRTDEAVQVCLNNSISIYTVGVPAPFGRPETVVKWVDPDPEYDQSPKRARVNQGPETPRPERLTLDFINGDDDLEQIDSGFGPFFLTRLCYETGGLYFAVHPNRDPNNRRRIRWSDVGDYAAKLSYFFDPDIMRRYQPEYVSLESYNSQLSSSQARQALVRAAEFSQTGTLEQPQLFFPRTDEARFVRRVSEAQKDAAFVEPELRRLVAILETGERDRRKEEVARWQAGFDLALGRALSAKLRAESYNQLLALAKTKLKFDPPVNDKTPQNNTWVLQPSSEVGASSRAKQAAAKARELLERVVDEHPGTPWSLLAQRELKIPIGWKWTQAYTAPPKPRDPSQNNNEPPPERRPEENRDPKRIRNIPRL